MGTPGQQTTAGVRASRAPFVLAAILLLAAVSPPVREVGGVSVPEQLQWEGRAFTLNGAGLRTKFFVDVYVCALYLEARQAEPEAILGADAPWMLTLVFLREVDHETILESFREAFERNSPGQSERLRPGLVRLHDEVMSDLVVRRGQRLTFAYVPGSGSTLVVPDGRSSRVAGKEFGDALLRTFIGEKPSDPRLKAALLGRGAEG